jgi:glycosyl transferase family 87
MRSTSTKNLLVRAVEIVLFGAIPLIVVVATLSVYSEQGRLALDFHNELYAQAGLVWHGEHAFDTPDAYLQDRQNLVWPITAVLPVVPLTAIGPDAADWVAACFTIATLFAALFVLDVRDWRIYGVTLLWPSVIDTYQTANASLPIALLVALMWRFRTHAGLAGVALGYAIAVKFFVWPIAVWLFAIGKRTAALVAAGVAAASMLLMVPFTDLSDYVELVQKLRREFEHDVYTPFALLTDLGVPDTAARAITVALGLAVLALAWRRQSLGLAIAAALVLSPIVWRHFFVLLLVPLALSRPRFDAVWLIPIGLWVGDGTFNGAPWQTACVLALVALTFALCELRPRASGSQVLSAGPAHA